MFVASDSLLYPCEEERHKGTKINPTCKTRAKSSSETLIAITKTYEVESEHLEQLAEQPGLGVGGQLGQRTPLQHSHVLKNHAQETPADHTKIPTTQ